MLFLFVPLDYGYVCILLGKGYSHNDYGNALPLLRSIHLLAPNPLHAAWLRPRYLLLVRMHALHCLHYGMVAEVVPVLFQVHFEVVEVKVVEVVDIEVEVVWMVVGAVRYV